MKLTSKMLKKIIQEELGNIIVEIDPPAQQPAPPPAEEGMYNPITGEFVPGMTEEEVRALLDEYENSMMVDY